MVNRKYSTPHLGGHLPGMNNRVSPWFPSMRTELSAEPKLRLFCLPYAGGSASVFQTWAKHLPEAIDICPIQLPGRGRRIHETPIHHFPSLIKTIVQEITPYLNGPFAFFGHSLGGLIAFEISHQLYKEHLPLPLHLLVSGRPASRLRMHQKAQGVIRRSVMTDTQA